ncbi:MAG: diphthine synthase [Candidatus Nezhaarchaeota archaeon]|nr:diphthine synthase [Candidatus Nezhaarchaeota archaeon]
MTLYLIGLGLCSAKSLSIEGLKAAMACDKVYVELYTSLMPHLELDELRSLIGKEVKKVGREELEGKWAGRLVEEARDIDVAILTPGDPFIATTHEALRLEALKRGVKVRVIHAASIASAISGATGLSFYKFGRPATVVYPEPGYVSEAAYDVVKENLERGLHTLLLLDLKAERGMYMTAREAIHILLSIDRGRREGILTENSLVVAVARAGCSDVAVRAGRAVKVAEYELGPPPHSLVVPGALHFIEKEALVLMAGASGEEIMAHEVKMAEVTKRLRGSRG